MSKIEICKSCKEKSFDKTQGIVCGLTNAKPIFEATCPDYKKLEKEEKYISSLPIRSNRQRSNIAMLLIWIVLALEVLSLISNYLQYSLLHTAKNGAEITMEAANANDIRVQFISIIYLIAYVASNITFIMWFRRAYYNLSQKVNHLSHTDGWAAGAWFVPVVNLYRPYQMMKEMFVETRDYFIKTGVQMRDKFSTNSIGIWWTLWIIGAVIGQVVFRLSLHAKTVDEILFMTIIDIIGNVISIPLAISTVIVIKDYSQMEELLWGDREEENLRVRA